jgi:tRNA modification GTPase
MIVETIAAIATPPGKGGVGIVRVSGPQCLSIAESLIGFTPKPRYAHYAKFDDIDEGIVLFFPNPHSFTGEDVVEFQGHGGPIVLHQILDRVISLGARLAAPGEFSQRAFLNNKLDLAQVEAIADLIAAESEQAARSAMSSLQGVFSEKIYTLVDQLIKLRVYVEAAIDFPEEEIDFLKESSVIQDTEKLIAALENILSSARQGVLLRDGINVVIIGPPNAGKSSLLNALSGKDSAIVTDIAGTTRDILREQIVIDGMPLHIVDTAGLRETDDIVEKEGVRRAKEAIKTADVLLCVFDATKQNDIHNFVGEITQSTIILLNKIDLLGKVPSIQGNTVELSIQDQSGLDLLTRKLKEIVGFQPLTEGSFMARQRHIDLLQQATAQLITGLQQFKQHHAGELFAEDLRCAQEMLGKITGKFTSDDLLGEIFSSFCIGK